MLAGIFLLLGAFVLYRDSGRMQEQTAAAQVPRHSQTQAPAGTKVTKLAQSTLPVKLSLPVWSYYDFPPFVTGPGQGLLYELVERLNNYARGGDHFVLKLYPRKRLDSLLAEKKQGIVLFVHWSYMGDADKRKYLWGPALVNDSNMIVSRINQKVYFDGSAASLRGLRFGAVLGHRYPRLQQAIELGEIIRQNTSGEAEALRMLLAGRVDVISAPKPVLYHLNKTMQLEGQLFISPIPRLSYSRHIMVTDGLAPTHELLTQFVQQLAADRSWQATLASYGY